MTSARPSRIMSSALPMLWLPEAQAVEMHRLGPRSLCWMATLAAAMLEMMMGTVSG